jgi:hypothetical protein
MPVTTLLLTAVLAERTTLRQTPLQELAVARITEPDRVMGVLRELSLDAHGHWRGDLAALNTHEQAEMI